MTAPITQKTIYIPYMCDHGYAVAAAFEAQGMKVEAMPPPDDESLAIGLDVCRGRECLPCFTTTGDVIRRAQQPDFDPERSVMLLPTAAGLCRYGQYKVLQRQILEDHGLGAVELIAPTANDSYQSLGGNPMALRRLAWKAIVAVDLLQKLLHQFRPYEVQIGSTNAAYHESLQDIVETIRLHGDRRIPEAMKRMAKRFESLESDRSVAKPLIGVVGEIYVRLNAFTNQHIIERIEAAGGEVALASVMEWMYFTNWAFSGRARALGQYGDFLSTLVADVVQKVDERSIARPVAHLLREPSEAPIGKVMAHLKPYYEPVMGLETEAGLSLGKAVEWANEGFSGIVNVMPFSCMPGIVVAGMAPRFRKDLDSIPWLDISFSAQGETNIKTRLEAFMYQARQFHLRQGAA